MLQQPSINVRNSSTSRSLQLRIVVGKILLQPLKEIPLAILLAFQADANERRDCLAHARIDRLRVPRHLIGDTGS